MDNTLEAAKEENSSDMYTTYSVMPSIYYNNSILYVNITLYLFIVHNVTINKIKIPGVVLQVISFLGISYNLSFFAFPPHYFTPMCAFFQSLWQESSKQSNS